MVGLVESRKIAGGACFAILYSIPIMHHQPANPHEILILYPDLIIKSLWISH